MSDSCAWTSGSRCERACPLLASKVPVDLVASSAIRRSLGIQVDEGFDEGAAMLLLIEALLTLSDHKLVGTVEGHLRRATVADASNALSGAGVCACTWAQARRSRVLRRPARRSRRGVHRDETPVAHGPSGSDVPLGAALVATDAHIVVSKTGMLSCSSMIWDSPHGQPNRSSSVSPERSPYPTSWESRLMSLVRTGLAVGETMNHSTMAATPASKAAGGGDTSCRMLTRSSGVRATDWSLSLTPAV